MPDSRTSPKSWFVRDWRAEKKQVEESLAEACVNIV